MLESMICRPSNTLLEVMHEINNNCRSVAFIECPVNGLVGVVTDGDIRRAILSGTPLTQQISTVMNLNYVFAKSGATLTELVGYITNDVKIVPIVNPENFVVNFYSSDQSVSYPVSTPNLSGKELTYLTDAFLSTWISSQGEYLDQFEERFANYCECAHGVAVSNGTAALHLALMALDIKEGDEVLIPNLTFAATANAVIHANATPVIVDIEKESWCISPEALEAAITKRTKAIIPVHLYGQPCDMAKIMHIAKKYNLRVIEDCAEAHGAIYEGQKVGSFGDIGCFSFYGNKVITTGEGGMCVTNSKELSARMILLKNHGMSTKKKYWHDVVGYNYRMTNLQAALGVAQLERIDKILQSRRRYENDYRKVLADEDIQFQKDYPERKRITWLASLLLGSGHNREKLIDKLRLLGVDARPFFIPLSEMPLYKKYAQSQSYSNSIEIGRLGINLPTNESLKSSSEIQKILKQAFNERND
ncbi:aminotransferase class I/II-fold pyridoxal phosphate-dependent enzyme [Polynucleobacter sp. UB-Siik-W21]|uniref:aminotransferase class I/II-fold pyridoxal phosphate-dependent enzyme n=1 Tax=Polynucleobacter sp. UB-Siik-W21 TaxID=1855646 RepID=UPI001BFE8B69|nr:aminotransferase class I/II-fold pyridoxal phosphate-dependent enzyme [Polynucleobacter sp. UB-Siik-W21]QWD70708.1 aminotransferase class I/II-fold pyridoxal phosphate-dependent enzyme [Polynucleobacter sp. UB-Siik-W21]